MKRITKNKSISIKTAGSKALPKKRPIFTVSNYFFVFFGIVLGFLITFFVVKSMEGKIMKKLKNASLTANRSSAQKYPTVNSASLSLPVVSVLGYTESASENEIKIKIHSCQGDEVFTGKISAKTVIVKKERQGDSSTLRNVMANISDVKNGNLVTLEAFGAIRRGQMFDVKRVIIQEPLLTQKSSNN